MKIDKSTGEISFGVFLRTPFNYDVDKHSDASALHCLDPSLASQSEAKDADINEIVRRFGITGELPQNYNPPQYGDFTDIGDYRSALAAVRDAAESFMEMPADLRAKFHNDPAELIDYLADVKNRDEAISLGLVNGVPVDLATAPTVETPVQVDATTS